MKEIICTQISLSPDKWERVILHFAVTESEGKKPHEVTIELPRVTINKYKNKNTGEWEDRESNAFVNGRFTSGFRKRACRKAIATFFPEHQDDIKHLVAAKDAVIRAARELEENLLGINGTLARLQLDMDRAPIMDATLDMVWKFYCSTNSRIYRFGRESADMDE